MASKHFNQESGQSFIEYTLLLGLLALAMVGSISLLGINLDARFAVLDSALAQVVRADSDASDPGAPSEPGGAGDADEVAEDDEGDADDAEKPDKPDKPTKPGKPGKPTKPLFPWLP